MATVYTGGNLRGYRRIIETGFKHDRHFPLGSIAFMSGTVTPVSQAGFRIKFLVTLPFYIFYRWSLLSMANY